MTVNSLILAQNNNKWYTSIYNVYVFLNVGKWPLLAFTLKSHSKQLDIHVIWPHFKYWILWAFRLVSTYLFSLIIKQCCLC